MSALGMHMAKLLKEHTDLDTVQVKGIGELIAILVKDVKDVPNFYDSKQEIICMVNNHLIDLKNGGHF